MCKNSIIVSFLTVFLSPASHCLLFPSFMKNVSDISELGGKKSQTRASVSSLVAVKVGQRIASSLSWVEEL